MFKILVPAAAALGLAALAAQTHSEGVEPAVTPMGWHLSQEGEMVKLAYGVANSDQLALMLTCSPGDRAAAAYGDVLPAGAHLVRTSGGAGIDPLSGELEQDVQVSLDDPALKDLAQRGRMAVEGDVGRAQISATKEERRLAATFLSYCATTRT
jgi:hypothetical protein